MSASDERDELTRIVADTLRANVVGVANALQIAGYRKSEGMTLEDVRNFARDLHAGAQRMRGRSEDFAEKRYHYGREEAFAAILALIEPSQTERFIIVTGQRARITGTGVVSAMTDETFTVVYRRGDTEKIDRA